MSGIHFTLIRTPSNHIGTKPIKGVLSVQRKKILEGSRSSSVAKFPIQKLKKNSSLSMILLLLMVVPAFMHSLLPVACDASKVACKNKAYLLYRLFGRYSPLM